MLCCRGSPRSPIPHDPGTDAAVDIGISTRDPWDASGRGGQIGVAVRSGGDPRDFVFDWLDAHGKSALLTLNAERTKATDVPPGDYTIVANNRRTGWQTEYYASLALATVPSVVEYVVTHASSDTARDGAIVATMRNMDAFGHDVRYLWTSGVVTQVPELKDVRPGTYTITPLSAHSGEALAFMHACAPAVVRPSRG